MKFYSDATLRFFVCHVFLSGIAKCILFFVFAIEPVGLYMSFEEPSRCLSEVVNCCFVPNAVFDLSIRSIDRVDSDILLYC